MRVTEKGQVTIPKPIREKLGIVPGSEVDFIDDGISVVLVNSNGAGSAAAREKAIEAWAEKVKGIIDLGGMTTDEYMEWLRGPRDDLSH